LGRIFRIILALAALALAVVVIYAVFFDLPAPTRDVVVPVTPSHA
jgi:hypothetical protein